jgi:hypothetical protein
MLNNFYEIVYSKRLLIDITTFKANQLTIKLYRNQFSSMFKNIHVYRVFRKSSTVKTTPYHFFFAVETPLITNQQTFEENICPYISRQPCYHRSVIKTRYNIYALAQLQSPRIIVLDRCHRQSSDTAREPLAVVAAALRNPRGLDRGLEQAPSALLCGNFAARVSLLSNAR